MHMLYFYFDIIKCVYITINIKTNTSLQALAELFWTIIWNKFFYW